MRFAIIITALLCTLALAGCGSSNDQKNSADSGHKQQQKTILDAQMKDIQKAKDVNKTMEQQKARMDAQIKQAEGKSASDSDDSDQQDNPPQP
ncbi:MAG: hypothetical protein PVI37_03960 [Gammaproteobacteria bacterium]